MIVAIDTGGTKTLITLFSRDGVAGKKIKFPTPQSQHEYIIAIKDCLQKQYGGQRIDAVVIGVPSIVSNNVALRANNLKWKNFDIAHSLKGVLGPADIFLENDANLGGLAEVRSRSPVPKNALYVAIGTGIGTGIIINGKIDPNFRLSEGGQSILEFNGMLSQWESFASGRAIYKAYGKYARDIDDSAAWNDIADRISRGLLSSIPLLQPSAVIIGGSMGTYFEKYSHTLVSKLKKNLPWDIECPSIFGANHPEEAVIYGCYYYGVDKLSR